MELLTEDIEFRDRRAKERFAQLIGFSGPQLGILIESSPDPDQVIRFLERLRKEAPEGFSRISSSPTALRYAVAVFGFSIFLSETVIRNPDWLLDISSAGDTRRVLRTDEFEERLAVFLGPSFGGVPSAFTLARFRRRELLRLVLRDVLGLGSLSDVTEELSNLADAILNVSLRAIRAEFAERLDAPAGGEFSVLALGKLGGRELNYSSDIDLMFIYAGDDAENGHSLTHKEFFKRVANHFTELLSTYTSDGLCYRVDLRLRPDGRYGEACHSLDGARQYYRLRARDWELQMLIKARVAGGDPGPGRELLEYVEPLIYKTTLDFKTIESVAESRQRIHEKLRRSRNSGVDVKLANGGIRDIEFLVQCLQRLHGGWEPWVRHGGTMMALFRLRDKDFLSDREYARLVAAYQFLRNLEHRLQFLEDRQTHTLPTELEDIALLARKMPESTSRTMRSASALEREIDEHFSAVREIYERVIHAQRAEYFSSADIVAAPAPAPLSVESADKASFPPPNMARFLEQRAPRFRELLRNAELKRGNERFEHFLEKIATDPVPLAMLETNEELALGTIDFFDHSVYFSDQLIRYPGLLHEVAQACGVRQGRVGFNAPHELGALRRFFREQMVRIQSDSVYHRVDVYRTLKRTSDLADSVITAAYRIALTDTIQSGPRVSAGYTPRDQMMVIALGRLGMREFDLASDADLVFVVPDEDASEMPFWTAVAERIIHVISAYTGDGVIFTVDTRLRPNGRGGALVQSESAYGEYFAHQAEAWEGIAYMKARAVFGNIERAIAFLTDLQQVDWRRYGQSGRSRLQLAEMRARIEKEQGAKNPLKAGPGGYYDIDFILLYLRLKGAGLFFKVLNTPARIDVIEKMGHLDREEAAFLLNAATFYRAIDHGLRVATGHAEGALPTAPSQRAILGELVERWSPEGFRQSESSLLLQTTLAQVRVRTRAFFDRIFS